MQALTLAGEQSVQDLASRYGVSVDAVKVLLFAVSAGGGTMAQFHHPELGGGGQWMRGGMTMVGDMFNYGLQAKVSGLCSELSSLLASQQLIAPAPRGSGVGGHVGASGNTWWPPELGNPSSSGGQNDARYAYFPAARRLAIQRDGRVRLYDTLDHQIGGVQQQQGGAYGSLSFASQFGTFTVDSLPVVEPSSPHETRATQPDVSAVRSDAPPPNSSPGGDVFAAIERLAQLHQAGILTDDEFRTKKAELLARV